MNGRHSGNSRETFAFLAIIFVIAVWGETFVSSKVLLGHGMTPADIFFFRFVLAYLCMWLLPCRKLFSDSLGDELLMVLLGFTGGSLYFLAENTALEYSTASNVAILVSSTPVLTAILMSALYREERLNFRSAAGSAIAFVGMVLVVLNGQIVLHLNPKGDALALCAAICWASYSAILQKVGRRYDVRFVTRKVFFYGILTIIPYFLAVRPLNIDMQVLSRPVVWGNLLYLGLIASMLCFVLWNRSVGILGTVRTTNILYSQPFFTMLAAFIVLGERITWMAMAGAALIVAGMVIFEKNRKKRTT